LNFSQNLAGYLWIIWVQIGSSLIFYFVAIDDWSPPQMHAETYTRLGTGAPASYYAKYDHTKFCSDLSQFSTSTVS
jgi:hypothetical protein